MGSTLFVGGLTAECTEDELQDFFRKRFGGFEGMKFHPGRGGKPGICWVKFAPSDADGVFNALSQGVDYLPSNPTVALRPEWAKNDLDAPRSDYGGHGAAAHTWASPPPPARAPQYVPPPIYVPPPAPAPSATPACDTMFIGSLAPHTSEDDVHAILSDLRG